MFINACLNALKVITHRIAELSAVPDVGETGINALLEWIGIPFIRTVGIGR